MSDDTIMVALVLADDLGERLVDLARHMYVWVVESPQNQDAVKIYMEDEEALAGPGSLTTFQFDQTQYCDELAKILDLIDDHHNEESTGVLKGILVYGLIRSPEVDRTIVDCGFRIVDQNAEQVLLVPS